MQWESSPYQTDQEEQRGSHSACRAQGVEQGPVFAVILLDGSAGKRGRPLIGLERMLRIYFFGYRKVRYKGLAKNHAQLFTLFALGNLVLAGRCQGHIDRSSTS